MIPLSKSSIEQAVKQMDWESLIDDDGSGAVFRDSGRSAVECTGYAIAVATHLFPGRTAVLGFFEESNPSSRIARDCGGHDFALVDSRYIVDPWLNQVESYSKKSVFDILDPDDAEVIADLYGKNAAATLASGGFSVVNLPRKVELPSPTAAFAPAVSGGRSWV